MYSVIDNFFNDTDFDFILSEMRNLPINNVPENYDGKRCSYKNRLFLTEKNALGNVLSKKFPFKKGYKRRIELANDVDGFWLYPHSDHPEKKDVTVIYVEGDKNNGTTFITENGKETIDFVSNRIVKFNPDKKSTYDEDSAKHCVEKMKINNVRRTIVVTYVDDNKWNNLNECYD